MTQVWKLFLLLAALLMFKYVTSDFAIDYNELDMRPVRETAEERNMNAVNRASDDDAKNSIAWDQTKIWVVVCSTLSFCFLILPLLVYLLCPKACVCGCKPVTLQRNN